MYTIFVIFLQIWHLFFNVYNIAWRDVSFIYDMLKVNGIDYREPWKLDIVVS